MMSVAERRRTLPFLGGLRVAVQPSQAHTLAEQQQQWAERVFCWRALEIAGALH